MRFGGIFDVPLKRERLEEVLKELEDSSIWSKPEKAQALGKEQIELEKLIYSCDELKASLADNKELLDLIMSESGLVSGLEEAEQHSTENQETLAEIENNVAQIQTSIENLEFRRMFCGKLDAQGAFVDIQSGSGGTEAQDWAQMLLRMYLRWIERKGFKGTILEISDGDVAGIKGVTIKVEGEYAFGWLRSETGVHRLVRKSPFDSGNRRHTSFAAIFVSPIIDDTIEIDINPADLRIDTYRASGAGGQHVNKTDSAVRITHIPTGIVSQCQSDRSQHKNKAQAMSLLRAKLYEFEEQKRVSEQQSVEASKSDIGWGSQIRSYVLDDSRIKDLRTGVETSNTQGMLDGNLLDLFIIASLQQGV